MQVKHTLRELAGGSIVWDNHACMPLETDCAQMDSLAAVHDAGIDVLSLNVASGEQKCADALRMLTAFRSWIGARTDKYLAVGSAADAQLAMDSGRLGICFDIEGMSVLDGNLELVQLYYDLGVRWMLSAYNTANAVGSGCLDATDMGLTPFGRAVVGEMNRVGMVVCASHAGYRTARELIDASAAPVIFSHSNPRALWDSPRNVPDELMKACANRGGVVGLNGIGAFLGPNDIRIETLARHVLHALELIGEDHVGIALDYCFGMESGMVDFALSYPALFPADHGFERDGIRMIPPWQLKDLAGLLHSRGVQIPVLAKLLGGNHMRIAKAVWQ